ncbi:MAG: hypothetical protein JXN60_08825 [Lentisphaerae bacterium]|nr:hypothetical protein [Lentisphaerota bacterium]
MARSASGAESSSVDCLAPRVFRAIEALCFFFWDDALPKKEPLAQASSCHRLLLDCVVDTSETSGLDFTFSDLSACPVEEILRIAVEHTEHFLELIQRTDTE